MVGLVVVAAVLALAAWPSRRQRALYPSGHERLVDPEDSLGFTGVGMAETFRDEP